MISTSKLRRARISAEEGNVYAKSLLELIISLYNSSYTYAISTPLITGRSREITTLLIIISSDKGLCSGFNSGINKLTRKRIKELEDQGKDYKVLFIGKKSSQALNYIPTSKILAKHYGICGKDLNYFWFQKLCNNLLNQFDEGEFDACEIIFNDFRSMLSQVPILTRIIPIYVEEKSPVWQEERKVYSFDTNEDNTLNILLKLNFTAQIYNAVLLSNASEHAARMIAMENATRNADEMIKSLTTLYNRSRQAQITKELIEIISGANF